MRVSTSIFAITVAVAAFSGAAHAESYDGVHASSSVASRAEVARQGAIAARDGGVSYASQGSTAAEIQSSLSRSEVRAGAVAQARHPLDTIEAQAFYRDQVPTSLSVDRASGVAQQTRN